MALRLRPDLVLVKLAPPAEQTRDGILTPHSLPPTTAYGKAVQVGSKVRDVEVGDLVCFSPRDGDPIDGFPTPHLLVSERQIAGVIIQ